jgi:hypothetical protein
VVKKTFHQVLRAKKFSLRQVAHEVSVGGEGGGGADPHGILKGITAEAANDFSIIITANCIWSYWSIVHSSEWSISRDLVMARTVEKSVLKKSMFRFICRRHGVSAFDNLSTGCKMNSQ